METLVLEPSSNTHEMRAKRIIDTERIDASTTAFTVMGENVISHGEHGTLSIEAEPNQEVHAIKYNQKELNPVTKAIQNAFD